MQCYVRLTIIIIIIIIIIKKLVKVLWSLLIFSPHEAHILVEERGMTWRWGLSSLGFIISLWFRLCWKI